MNTLHHNNKTYIAREQNTVLLDGTSSCFGCALLNNHCETITEAICVAAYREDNRNIIWIEKDQENANPAP